MSFTIQWIIYRPKGIKGYCSKSISNRSCVFLNRSRHTAVYATQHCEDMDGGGMSDG